jgi:opacity protein-like surface antigen
MDLSNKLTSIALAVSSISINAYGESKYHDWSGPYYGGMLSSSKTNADSSSSYTNDGANPSQGWSNNQFHGNVFNSINTMAAEDPRGYGVYGMSEDNTPTNSDMPNPSAFLSNLQDRNQTASLNLFIGNSKQFNNIVVGGEFRAAFGNFGAASESSLNSSGSKNGSFSDYEGAQVSFTNYNSVLSGISSPIRDWQGVNYSATYQQTSSQINKTDFNNSNSMVGRIGYAFGDFMIYGLGGLAFANVNARTSTTINESVTGNVGTISPDTSTSFSGQSTYSFAGERSKNMFGYSIGTGVEWAMKENIIIRLEAEYFNLGSISVTGHSQQTSASYNIKQEVYGHNLSTGIAFKF